MKLLKIGLGDAAADVALDEALQIAAESGQYSDEVLRIWQPQHPFVVLGRSSPIQSEVNTGECRQHGVPVIRRCSGGSSILTAPGCLMYAVLLSFQARPKIRAIDAAHAHVMQQTQSALASCGIDCQIEGISDLAIDGRKVSGNSCRIGKEWLLYHGTLITTEMDLSLISQFLGHPKRQPAYRNDRTHDEFLAGIPASTVNIANALEKQWDCQGELGTWPEEATQMLVRKKYSSDDWNLKH